MSISVWKLMLLYVYCLGRGCLWYTGLHYFEKFWKVNRLKGSNNFPSKRCDPAAWHSQRWELTAPTEQLQHTLPYKTGIFCLYNRLSVMTMHLARSISIKKNKHTRQRRLRAEEQRGCLSWGETFQIITVIHPYSERGREYTCLHISVIINIGKGMAVIGLSASHPHHLSDHLSGVSQPASQSNRTKVWQL